MRGAAKAMKSDGKTLARLFLSTLYISAFTFGGGFAIVSLMKKKFVDELHWIDEDEMLDITAIAQSSPGAIAVNAAIMVGRHVAGGAGTLVAVAGTIIPPMVILSAISLGYEAFAQNVWVAAALKGMQAGVAAVIADVTVSLAASLLKAKRPVLTILAVAAFVCAFFLGVNVIYIVLAAVAAGVALELAQRARKRGSK